MSTITRPPKRPRLPARSTETRTVTDEERGVIRDVSWEFYDRLTDAIGQQSHIRVAYDGKDLEIMTVGPKHERSKGWLGEFIHEIAIGLGVELEPMGSTTWKRFDEVMRWLADRKSSRQGDWIRRLRRWIQTELRARIDANAARSRPTRERKP